MQSVAYYDLKAEAQYQIMESHPILRNPNLSVKVTSGGNDFVPCATSTPARIKNVFNCRTFGLSPVVASNFCHEKRHSVMWNLGSRSRSPWGQFDNRESQNLRRASYHPMSRTGTSRGDFIKLEVVSDVSEDEDFIKSRKSLRPPKKGSAKLNHKNGIMGKQSVRGRTSAVVMKSITNAPVQEAVHPIFPDFKPNVGDLDVYTNNFMRNHTENEQVQPIASDIDQVIKESEYKVMSWIEMNRHEMGSNENQYNEDNEDIVQSHLMETQSRVKRRGENHIMDKLDDYGCENGERSRSKRMKLVEIHVDGNRNDVPIKEVTNLTRQMNQNKKTRTPKLEGPVKRPVRKTNFKPDGKKSTKVKTPTVTDIKSGNVPPQPAKEKKNGVRLESKTKNVQNPSKNGDNVSNDSELMIIEVDPSLVCRPTPGMKKSKATKGRAEPEKVVNSGLTKKNFNTKSEGPPETCVANLDLIHLTTPHSSFVKESQTFKKLEATTFSPAHVTCPAVTSFTEIDEWKEVNGKPGVAFSKLIKSSNITSGFIKLLPKSVLAKSACNMQVFTAVQGTGEIAFVDVKRKIKPGNVIFLPLGSEYSIKNIGRKDFVISYVKVIAPKHGS